MRRSAELRRRGYERRRSFVYVNILPAAYKQPVNVLCRRKSRPRALRGRASESLKAQKNYARPLYFRTFFYYGRKTAEITVSVLHSAVFQILHIFAVNKRQIL